MRKKTKFFLLRTTIILLFVILAGRVWELQVVMGSYYKHQADTSKLRLESVEALRGIVYDRYGTQLVWNAPSWNITIVPHGIPRDRAWTIYRKLSRLLHGDPKPPWIAWKVRSNEWQAYASILIKPKVSPDTAMVIKQLHSLLPGVRAEPSSVRHYREDPEDPGFSLAHILGYTGAISPERLPVERRLYPIEHVGPADQMGREGVEASTDQYLHGVNSTDVVEVDSGERPVRVVRRGKPVAGDDVYLTIDWNLQRQVARDLAAGIHQLGVDRGVAVVENVRTGEILSMVSLPSYNNNWFSGRIEPKQYDALLHAPGHPLINLATSGLFPPGSTYKVITATAALQTGVADVNRTIDDTGAIKICSPYNPDVCKVFAGWDPNGLGEMNVVSALARSSDIYFYTVAGGNPNLGPMPRVGGERLAFWARQMGLGTQTDIEIPGEARGLVPSPSWYNHLKPQPGLKNPGDVWQIGQTYNMAIGQGFNLVTPLQMVNVAATIANGGTLYRPRIIRHIEGLVIPRRGVLHHRQMVQPFVPSIVRRNFISPANLALIQEGMHLGVTSAGHDPYWGTSYNVRDPRFDAAGKTGTAEAPDGAPHAWWIGYAPFNQPQVAVAILVPNADSEGAAAAAPIAHKVFEDYFHLKPLKKDWLQDVTHLLVGTGTQ